MQEKINDFPDGLQRLMNSLEPSDPNNIVRQDRISGLSYIQKALESAGHTISLSQSEMLWSEFSYSKHAGWLELPSSTDEAEIAIVEFCNDIENGENHSDL